MDSLTNSNHKEIQLSIDEKKPWNVQTHWCQMKKSPWWPSCFSKGGPKYSWMSLCSEEHILQIWELYLLYLFLQGLKMCKSQPSCFLKWGMLQGQILVGYRYSHEYQPWRHYNCHRWKKASECIELLCDRQRSTQGGHLVFQNEVKKFPDRLE